MRKREIPQYDIADEPALRLRLETPSLRKHAASLGWGVELRHGTCARARCRSTGGLTYIGLCPACFKAACDGQLVKTEDGRWRHSDITMMRAVVQGSLEDRIAELESKAVAS